MIVVGVAAVIDLGIRYVPALQALQDGRDAVMQARTLLGGDIGHLDPSRLAAARALMDRAEADFGPRSAVLADGWIGSVLDVIPGASRQVDAIRALRSTGAAATRVGHDVTDLIADIAPAGVTNGQGSALSRLAAIAAQRRGEVARDVSDLAALKTAIDAVPSGPLLGPITSARDTVVRDGSRLTDVAGPAVSVLQALPAAIGPGTHSYLLLLNNPGEQRPGGGFIGAVGEVDFHDGQLASVQFLPGEFANHLVPATPAPRPLDTYLFHGHPWELDDANWSPDFLTSMGTVASFYTKATGHTVDGAISIDPIALGYVLAITGPIQVPPFPQVIRADNALLELNYITNQARPGDPGKVFLAPFGQALVNRVLHTSLGDLPALAASLARSASEKHIVLSFSDPYLQSLVDHASFSGRLTAPLSDSLLIADANLSGTKGDLFVTRSFAVDATVDANGNVRDQLALTYRNPRQTQPANASLVRSVGGEYRDYVRVYVPETARLDRLQLSRNGGPPVDLSPESVTWETEREAIAYWLIVPAGETATLTLTYEGPFADISRQPEAYAMVWQKQVNSLDWPASITIHAAGRTTVCTTTLVRDQTCAP